MLQKLDLGGTAQEDMTKGQVGKSALATNLRSMEKERPSVLKVSNIWMGFILKK